MNIEQLSEFLGHEDNIISYIATQMTAYAQERNSGAITPEEAKELTEDLLDLQRVAVLTDNLNRNAKITQACLDMREIASTVLCLL